MLSPIMLLWLMGSGGIISFDYRIMALLVYSYTY